MTVVVVDPKVVLGGKGKLYISTSSAECIFRYRGGFETGVAYARSCVVAQEGRDLEETEIRCVGSGGSHIV